MKKCFKIFLGVIGILVLTIGIDIICIFTINRPIFSQGEDYETHAVYRGLFFDTYVCPEFSMPQIKTKGAKYTCAVLEVEDVKDINEEHHFKAKVIEVHDGYIIVEPTGSEEERNSSDKFRIDNKNNAIYKKGQILAITYIGGINESYPAQIGVTNILIVDSN